MCNVVTKQTPCQLFNVHFAHTSVYDQVTETPFTPCTKFSKRNSVSSGQITPAVGLLCLMRLQNAFGVL
jgi:hypothetical protein